MVYEWPVGFRFSLHFFPFRIGLESSPILLRFRATGMFQDVDKQILRTRCIFGRPVTNTLHAVPPEDRVGVITEAISESIHFALLDVVQAQFVDVLRRLWVGRAELAERE